MSRPRPDCPSRLRLDRFLHGELDRTEEGQGISDHLARCPDCRAWAEATRGTEERIAQGLDSESFAREVVARRASTATRGPWSVAASIGATGSFIAAHRWLWGSAAAAGVLLAVLFLVRGPWGPGVRSAPRGIEEDTVIKGGSSLQIFRQRGGQVAELLPPDGVRAGDALRFKVFSDRFSHVLVLGLDIEGQVEVYVPWGGQESTSILPGRMTVLGKESVVLGESGGDELVLVLFSARPIQSASAMDQVRTAFLAAGHDLRAIRKVPLAEVTLTRLLRRAR